MFSFSQVFLSIISFSNYVMAGMKHNTIKSRDYYYSGLFAKNAYEWVLVVIPGLTRNPEDIEKPGFPTKDFGNDDKRSAVVLCGRNDIGIY
ncbi:MAG: hypothetical protein AB1480_14890 [Nitrospirota bacterium]